MSEAAIKLDAVKQPWLQSADARAIFGAIEKAGGAARFVGGAVRDAVLGRIAGDIDIATTLTPDKMTAALHAAGIKVVPTGIAHGTVTAVVGQKGYEITTLRRDVETDGRHAAVAFTDDWRADAARRDFTFNALYADADGTVTDYFGGIADLAEGRARFIGDAEMRIKEDVLRILRFFRFYAWFGKGIVDADGLIACQALAGLLPQLSAERVWTELCKLLQAPDPVPAWELMHECDVLAAILPEAIGLPRLRRLVIVEKEHGGGAVVRRLAALLIGEAVSGPAASKLATPAQGRGYETQNAAFVAQRLRMSRMDSDRLSLLVRLPERLRGKIDPVPLRQVLYGADRGTVRDGLLLLAADEGKVDVTAALATVEDWEAPVLPVSGEDVLALGVSAGTKVGEALRAVEQWWMAKDFRPVREECLWEMKRVVGRLVD